MNLPIHWFSVCGVFLEIGRCIYLFPIMCFQVEHVVREENTMAAYDLLEIYCELIVTRLPIVESQKYVADKLNHSIKEFILFYYFCVV